MKSLTSPKQEDPSICLYFACSSFEHRCNLDDSLKTLGFNSFDSNSLIGLGEEDDDEDCIQAQSAFEFDGSIINHALFVSTCNEYALNKNTWVTSGAVKDPGVGLFNRLSEVDFIKL